MSIYIQIDDPYKVIKKMSQKKQGFEVIHYPNGNPWVNWGILHRHDGPPEMISLELNHGVAFSKVPYLFQNWTADHFEFFFQWNMANCGYPSTLNEKFGW
jgi:hypothetical protein